MASLLSDEDRRTFILPYLPLIGTGILGVLSILPLVRDTHPVQLFSSGSGLWSGYILVSMAMLAVIGLRAWVDKKSDPWALWLALVFIFIAAAMTSWHWLTLDARRQMYLWQQDSYLQILNHTYGAPHQYRMLPYGFTRLLELRTHDWAFSCMAYKWFFNYWLVWAWYGFARQFHSRRNALFTLILLIIYYPLSVRWYWGQLTDPMSHALFILAMIYTLQNRSVPLLAVLAVGVGAKETALIMVPVYFFCQCRYGWISAGVRTTAIAIAGVAAFLVARLPLGWAPHGTASLNGVDGLMISTNLGLYLVGIGQQIAMTPVPLSENYVHVLLFIVPFLPFILGQWSQLDFRLKAMLLVLVPLLFGVNLCFSWLYESRNYIPLLPLMATLAMPGFRSELDRNIEPVTQ